MKGNLILLDRDIDPSYERDFELCLNEDGFGLVIHIYDEKTLNYQ